LQFLFSDQRAAVHKKLYAALQRYDPRVANLPWSTFYHELVALELVLVGFITATSADSVRAVAISLLTKSELQEPGRNKLVQAEGHYSKQMHERYSHTGMSGYTALTTLFVERLGVGSSEVTELIEGDLAMLAETVRRM
jgi:hypothetical protein